MLIDTHCHLDFDHFDSDREEVIQRALQAGVTHIVVPGIDLPASRRAVALAERYPPVYAAVGIHPNDIPPDTGSLDSLIQQLRGLAQHPKVVAIGEIGLDYYRDRTPADLQHLWLGRQLALATELHLPVILHNREASEDILDLLSEWVSQSLPPELQGRAGVLHSFSGTWEDAHSALEMGFFIGFTGPITYKAADRLRHVAASVPLDHILLETDAPFLSPHPYRGERNEPAYVCYVAQKLAEIRDLEVQAVASQTTSNAKVLFGWE
jgi:TatD DNase family protein